MKRRRNIAKLLAKLNTKIMPLVSNPGRGTSIPEETGIDIAAALGASGWSKRGMTGARRLAILVLCLRWWPGLFDGPPRVVGFRDVARERKTRQPAGRYEELTIMVTPALPKRSPGGRLLTKDERAELRKQRLESPPAPRRQQVRTLVQPERNEKGRLKWEAGTETVTTRVPVEVPIETQAFIDVASLVANFLERSFARRARALGWEADPKWRGKLVTRMVKAGRKGFETWARVVIAEYRNPNHCPTCTPWGRPGEVPMPVFEDQKKQKIVRVEWITCDTCFGGGTLAWSVKRRAKAFTISEHVFRNGLNQIHDAALSLLRELEYRGARLFLSQISDER